MLADKFQCTSIYNLSFITQTIRFHSMSVALSLCSHSPPHVMIRFDGASPITYCQTANDATHWNAKRISPAPGLVSTAQLYCWFWRTNIEYLAMDTILHAFFDDTALFFVRLFHWAPVRFTNVGRTQSAPSLNDCARPMFTFRKHSAHQRRHEVRERVRHTRHLSDATASLPHVTWERKCYKILSRLLRLCPCQL